MKREYEIGLIINPETTDEEVEKIKASITDILTKGNGTIESIDEWGRKTLAYPIEKHKEGIYVFIKTMSPGDVIAAVERRLKLNEKVMRFLVIRLDDKLRKSNKLDKKWKRIEKFSKKPAGDSERDRSTERPSSHEKEIVKETEDKAPGTTEKPIEAPAEKKTGEMEEKKVAKVPEVKEEKMVEKESEAENQKEVVIEEEKEKKTVKKVKTVEIEAGEEEISDKEEKKPVKPKKTTAKKATNKTEEKVDEEDENAETK